MSANTDRNQSLRKSTYRDSNRDTDRSSSSDSDEDDHPTMKLEDQLTFHKLKELEAIFEEADEDGGGGLDMDEFKIAMRKAMGKHVSDDDMDKIFMKVDTNCDGTVDWDEYLSYMLLEYRGKENMNNETMDKPLPKIPRKVANMNLYQRHHDTIVGIAYLPILVKTTSTLHKALDDINGKYMTVTKDGIVNLWNPDLEHIRRHRVTHANAKYQRKIGVWVTTCVLMQNLNMIAVATTSCNICFYDLTANKFSLVLNITGLDIAATCMEYWIHPSHLNKAKLFWGDSRGNIKILVFDDCPTICFLQPSLNKHFRSNVSLDDVMRGIFCGVKGHILESVHKEPVVCIKYYNILGTFLSCCRESTTALFQGDIERKKSIYFRVAKGVYAFDYCKYNNVLVTGGKDTIVRVWNPYVTSKPVMMLQGHKSPIIFVTINSEKEQIISISDDRDINIFDMSNQACIQTIFRKWVPIGPRQISAIFFNAQRQALLIGNNNLAIFEHQEKVNKTQLLNSHNSAVNKVLYNALFHQIVSGGVDSVVHVWDATTGERLIQFLAHKRRSKGGEEIAVEITCMKFDPTLRRLITSARDGNVRIWNFNNGALLRSLEITEHKEITSIVVARQRIFTAGWNRRINVHFDSMEDDTMMEWRRVHREDVLTMALLPPGTVASASYDGDIIVWSLETGNPLKLINANESVSPLLISSRCSRYEETDSAFDENIQITANGDDKTARGNLPNTTRSDDVSTESGSFMTRNRRLNNTSSVEVLLFLKTRETKKTSANLVAAGAEGWVRFWSIHADGGLIGQFNAAHFPGGEILSMVTDENNQYLITGCSHGYIKVWDIVDYCAEYRAGMEDDARLRNMRHHAKFVYIRAPECGKGWEERRDQFPNPPAASNPELTLKSPKVLTSFRGHIQGIVCMDFINHQSRIITCSVDCSIRVWTIEGFFVGICGRDLPWSPDPKNIVYHTKKTRIIEHHEKDPFHLGRDRFQKARKISSRIPGDIRAVASITTMRVLWGGVRPHWNMARNIMTIWIPLFRQFKKTPTISIPDMANKGKVDAGSVAEATRPQSSLHLDNKLPSIFPCSGDSNILGKTYKTNRKHQRMPTLPKLRHFGPLYDVYASLPYYSLTPLNPETLKPPQTLVELKERNRKMIANSNHQIRKHPAILKNMPRNKGNRGYVEFRQGIESKNDK